jgi:hypothetical protein
MKSRIKQPMPPALRLTAGSDSSDRRKHKMKHKMKHIEELIEELELNCAMAEDFGEAGDGKLTMRTATELRRLDKMLTNANELLRSAYQIAKREGESTNWEAWVYQLKNGLDDQHAVMHPSGHNAEVCHPPTKN